MAIFSALLFLTLPTNGVGGNFIAFFGVFLMLFLTAGLGSGLPDDLSQFPQDDAGTGEKRWRQ
jgi:hypothetical protein